MLHPRRSPRYIGYENGKETFSSTQTSSFVYTFSGKFKVSTISLVLLAFQLGEGRRNGDVVYNGGK